MYTFAGMFCPIQKGENVQCCGVRRYTGVKRDNPGNERGWVKMCNYAEKLYIRRENVMFYEIGQILLGEKVQPPRKPLGENVQPQKVGWVKMCNCEVYTIF